MHQSSSAGSPASAPSGAMPPIVVPSSTACTARSAQTTASTVRKLLVSVTMRQAIPAAASRAVTSGRKMQSRSKAMGRGRSRCARPPGAPVQRRAWRASTSPPGPTARSVVTITSIAPRA